VKVSLTKGAIKELKKIDKKYQKLITQKIKLLEKFPDTTNVKRLNNHFPPYRFRVGDYRVKFDVVDNEIIVYEIKHRKEAYK
jgi:mRNA interferase RelE/StbE